MPDEKISRINVTPNVTSRERTNRKGGKPPTLKPLMTNEKFRELLQGVLENPKLLEMKLPEIHFVVKLNQAYDKDKEIINALDKKKIRVVQVIDSETLLACAKTSDLNSMFKQKRQTTVQLLGRIRWLGVINPQDKLGESILKAIKEANDKTVIPVRILIPRDVTEEELQTFSKNIYKIVKDAAYSSFGNSFKAECTKKQIEDLVNLPFVEKILPVPKSQGQSTEAQQVSNGTIAIQNPAGDLPYACIIDTGIGDFMKPFCDTGHSFVGKTITDEDEESHGTSVASVALLGSQLTETTTSTIMPTSKVIPVKVAKDKLTGTEELGENIQEAVKKFKSKTRIFSSSFCYHPELDAISRKRIAQDFDRMIFNENIIFINAAGNIQESEKLNDKLSKKAMPILAPSDSHLTLSIGSGTINKKRFTKSTISRFGRSPFFLNETADKRCFFKPDIFTNGGDVDNSSPKSNLAAYLPKKIRSLDKAGNLIRVAGTSYAAPLIANMFCKLEKNSANKVKTADGLKSMLLSKCQILEFEKKKPVLVLPASIDPCACNDAIYIDFEYTNLPTIEAPKGKSKKTIPCLQINIPVDERIKSIDVFVSHSTSASDFDPLRHVSKILVEARKPGKNQGETRRVPRNIGNINDFAATTYGRYTCSKSPGLWTFSFHLEAKWIPPELLQKLQSRVGVSIRLNIKPKYLPTLKAIYENIKSHFEQKTATKTSDKFILTEVEPVKVAES